MQILIHAVKDMILRSFAGIEAGLFKTSLVVVEEDAHIHFTANLVFGEWLAILSCHESYIFSCIKYLEVSSALHFFCLPRVIFFSPGVYPLRYRVLNI